MGYSALKRMSEINQQRFGYSGNVEPPQLPACSREYGREALAFLRDDCENLKFDKKYADLDDLDGRSNAPKRIPYNMERDLDRLSLERALARFLDSGTREDAFDVYYCYCEIFQPFGSGYQGVDALLKMLSEHERNASSLLMKHRDHYSHSVYVFCIGLALYKNHRTIRDAYNKHFNLSAGQAACHFLEYWGMTSLFHDVGYPFEIAHQQMKSYIDNLGNKKRKANIDKTGYVPYISYKGMELFSQSRIGDLNDFFAEAITVRMGKYLDHTDTEPYLCRYKLGQALKDRAVHDDPGSMDYLYMDHAYFSGLVLIKTYLEQKKHITSASEITEPMLDSLCAIMLHNTLFKFTIRKILNTNKALSLDDGQPLTYLLMLCDELQCWNRTCYGKDTRSKLYPFDFDMRFSDQAPIRLVYSFDQAFESNPKIGKKSYEEMQFDGVDTDSDDDSGQMGSTKKTTKGRIKFLNDIDSIVKLGDVIYGFRREMACAFANKIIVAKYEEDKNPKKLTLSDSSYLSLYQFAIALNQRYEEAKADNSAEEKSPEEKFEEDLSLEYKLSNIAQAKRYGSILESVRCFYTDRAVYYEPVRAFEKHEVEVLAKKEHEQWCKEKKDMGWKRGDRHLSAGNLKGRMRECTRRHDLMKRYAALSDPDKKKNKNAIVRMVELLNEKDGLTIYKLPPRL